MWIACVRPSAHDRPSGAAAEQKVRTMRPHRGRLATLAFATLGLSAVTPAARAADWPTSGFDAGRTGYNPAETMIGAANVAGLKQSWAHWIDNAPVTAQPVVASRVSTPSGIRDLVIVGTEHGAIVAIDGATGDHVWGYSTGYRHTVCGDLPNGDFGISSAAAFDRPSNTVYSMGGDGQVYAFDAGLGALKPGWPVPVMQNPAVEHVYGGLHVHGDGIYAITASMCDQGTYHGRIVRISAAQHRVTNRFYVDGSVADGSGTITKAGPGGGGIWGSAGVSFDPQNNYLYSATGNVNASPQTGFYGNHVIKLLPNLSVVGASVPPLCQNCDSDFTSTPVVFRPANCGTQIAVLNKNGTVYTYDTSPLGASPRQQLTNHNFTGQVAYEPKRQSLISANLNGVNAYRVDASCNANLVWSVPGGSGSGGELGQAVSPPTIANGVVYYANGAGQQLIALDLNTGASLLTRPLGGYAFAQPTVVNGTVFIAAWDGSVRAYRP